MRTRVSEDDLAFLLSTWLIFIRQRWASPCKNRIQVPPFQPFKNLLNKIKPSLVSPSLSFSLPLSRLPNQKKIPPSLPF